MAKRFLLVLFFSVLLNTIFAQQRIPMQLEPSGIYTIPCEVNGLKLRFIFDTGASDVHLSLLDAAFMIKNGYIKKEDFIGKDSYFMADGSISENPEGVFVCLFVVFLFCFFGCLLLAFPSDTLKFRHGLTS